MTGTNRSTDNTCVQIASVQHTNLDFTDNKRVLVTLTVPPSTLSVISKAASLMRMELDDYVLLAAWIEARDQLAFDTDRKEKTPC